MTSDLAGKRVTVVGLGRSGAASVRLLTTQRARITVTDEKPATSLYGYAEQLPQGVQRRFGGFSLRDFIDTDLVVVSPGVAYDHPYLLRARAAGVPTVSELDLAYRRTTKPLIAVTGTNGKTTVTSWLALMLEAAGRRARVCGNIGYAFSAAVLENGENEVYVVETSSFQLEGIEQFRPTVGVILNVTPDHLDRHGTLDQYLELKLRLAMNQQPGDALIINQDDPLLAAAAVPGRGDVYAISRQGEVERGAYLDGDSVVVRIDGTDRIVADVRLLPLKGVHHEENLLATVLAASLMGVPDDVIAQATLTLKGLPHRLEFVGEVRGMRLFNDSKATNIGAVQKALENFSDGVVLLLGGLNKEIDFKPLAPAVRQRVCLLVFFGDARQELAQCLGDAARSLTATTLAEAVEVAMTASAPGRTLLFSPGCASFDEFASYEERGDRFKALVREKQG